MFKGEKITAQCLIYSKHSLCKSVVIINFFLFRQCRLCFLVHSHIYWSLAIGNIVNQILGTEG